MKKLLFSSLFVFFICNNSQSQPIFQKIYTGGNSGSSARLTPDGGYIITGYTPGPGGSGDFHLLKTDSAFNSQWMKSYGGNQEDRGNDVKVTSDGGYIATGIKGYPGGYGIQVFLLKTDANGDTLWTKVYREPGYGYEGTKVWQLNDQGYVIAVKFSGSFVYGWGLIRTDSSGNLLWGKEYYCDNIHGVWQNAGGEFIISGNTKAFLGNVRGVLIKTNSSGTMTWHNRYGIGNSNISTPTECSIKTNDGGYILGGMYNNYFSGVHACYLLKVDSLGDEMWAKTYDITITSGATSIMQTSDGGYIAAGKVIIANGNYDFFALRTDSAGNAIWMRKYVVSPGSKSPADILQTSWGGYAIVGSTNGFGAGSDSIYIITTGNNGISSCNDSVLNPIVSSISTPPVPQNISNYLHSLTAANPTITCNTITLQPTTLCSSQVNTEEYTAPQQIIYPNPFTVSAVIKTVNNNLLYDFSLYDIYGIEVRHKKNILNGYKILRENLSPGIYFYKLTFKNKISSGKLIVE